MNAETSSSIDKTHPRRIPFKLRSNLKDLRNSLNASSTETIVKIVRTRRKKGKNKVLDILRFVLLRRSKKAVSSTHTSKHLQTHRMRSITKKNQFLLLNCQDYLILNQGRLFFLHRSGLKTFLMTLLTVQRWIFSSQAISSMIF